MKILNILISMVFVMLVVVNFANASAPAYNPIKPIDVKIHLPVCDSLEYNHGGYTIPINTAVQINDKMLKFTKVIKASYPKNFDLAVVVVVSDIDKNGVVSNPVEKILTRGMKDEINGLLVWNTGIYPTNGKNLDVASFLVRLYEPAVFPNCVNSGLYELGVGDSMMINNVIINMNSIGTPQTLTTFDVLDKDGTYSVIGSKVGDEFDIKGLHIKVNENNLGWTTGSPWAHTRLEISKSNPEELSIRIHKQVSIYDSIFGRVKKV